MRANVLQEILIDGQAAGAGTPSVEISDIHGKVPSTSIFFTDRNVDSGRRKPASIRSRGDGVYVAEFTPQIEGPHHIDIFWSDQPIRGR